MFGRMSGQKAIVFFDYQTGKHCLLFKEDDGFLFVMSRTFRNPQRCPGFCPTHLPFLFGTKFKIKDKRQKTKDKRQKTKDKRQKIKDKR